MNHWVKLYQKMCQENIQKYGVETLKIPRALYCWKLITQNCHSNGSLGQIIPKNVPRKYESLGQIIPKKCANKIFKNYRIV